MKYVNLVHISDLHLHAADETGRYNQDLIIDALSADLSGLRDSPSQPDYIVFSGDLVQAADARTYKDAVAILSYLAEVSGLDDNKVFIIPGNHDASREAIGPRIPDLLKHRAQCENIDNLNSLARSPSFANYASEVFKSFERHTKAFGKSLEVNKGIFTRHYYLPDANIDLICLNTAILSGAGLTSDVADEGKIGFPERALVEALQRRKKGSKTIIVGHHPISHFHSETRDYLSSLINKEALLYLSGHLHKADPAYLVTPIGATTTVQSGALYASRDWWDGYAIIGIGVQTDAVKIEYRKWQEQRREFGVAAELSDSGVIYPRPTDRSVWMTIPSRLPMARLEQWRRETFRPYLIELLCDEGPEQAEDVFVEPTFEKDRYTETEQGLEKLIKPDELSYKDVMGLPENLVIAAKPESGKTSLIRHWAIKMASSPCYTSHCRVPVVLRFADLKKYLPQVEGMIRARVVDLPTGLQVRDLLDDGSLTIFIDDADLRSSDKMSVLSQLIIKYPACRYILLTGTPYLQGAGIAPVIVDDVPFTHIRLKGLKKSQILELIESRGTTDPAKADRLLHRMTQEAASLNVPITPVTGTFLIQIYTEDNGKPLVNRANLIERYVEIVLEKFAPVELLPATFDYRNKSDVLAFVAAQMCLLDTYSFSEVQIINMVEGYLSRYGLQFSAVDIVNYFIQARILSREAGSVSFRLSAFLAYFAALRMTEDTEFKGFILDKDRYLLFRNEINFYAAISRKDEAWLMELFSRFRETSEKVWADVPDNIRDGTLLDEFIPPGTDAGEDELFEVERRVFETPLTEEERRQALDSEADDDVISSQEIVRYPKLDMPSSWLSQLYMLSDMLKNMELIDTRVKEDVLGYVIKGWLQFASLTMGLIPTLARDRKLSYGGIEYRIIYPETMEVGEIARRIMSYLPISTAKVATLNLGSEKLRTQLEKGIGESVDGEGAGMQFMRASILSQMGVDGIAEVLKRLRGILKGHRYLEEVLVRQLAEIVVRFRLPDAELKSVRLLAANTMVDLEKSKGRKAAARRSELITSLTSARLKVRAGDADE